MGFDRVTIRHRVYSIGAQDNWSNLFFGVKGFKGALGFEVWLSLGNKYRLYRTLEERRQFDKGVLGKLVRYDVVLISSCSAKHTLLKF